MNKGYTKIPNELLDESKLSIQARFLLCVLLRHNAGTGKCFPTQITLGVELGRSPKQIRIILNELIEAKILTKQRRGYNRSNDYFISKKYIVKNLPSTSTINTGNETKPYHQKKYTSSTHPNADDLLNSKREIVKDNIYFDKQKDFSDKMHGFFDDLKQSKRNKDSDSFSNDNVSDKGENQKTKKPLSIREILDSKIKSAGDIATDGTAYMMVEADQVSCNSQKPTPAKTQQNNVDEKVYANVDSHQEVQR